MITASELNNFLDFRDKLMLGEYRAFNNSKIVDFYLNDTENSDRISENKIISAIHSVIEYLDDNKDRILITLLKDKIERRNNSIINKYSISDKNIAVTIRGIKKTIKHEMLSNDNRYLKIQKILDRNGCTSCKHHDIDYPSLPKYNSDICNSCIDRADLLSAELHKCLSIAEKKALDFVNDLNNNEYILQKAIVTKLNSKLKQNETSKQ